MFYTLRWDKVTSLPYYEGFMNSVLTYDEDSETWLLASKNKEVNGSSVAAIESMGTGAMTWQFDRDICNTNSLKPFQVIYIHSRCTFLNGVHLLSINTPYLLKIFSMKFKNQN